MRFTTQTTVGEATYGRSNGGGTGGFVETVACHNVGRSKGDLGVEYAGQLKENQHWILYQGLNDSI